MPFRGWLSGVFWFIVLLQIPNVLEITNWSPDILLLVQCRLLSCNVYNMLSRSFCLISSKNISPKAMPITKWLLANCCKLLTCGIILNQSTLMLVKCKTQTCRHRGERRASGGWKCLQVCAMCRCRELKWQPAALASYILSMSLKCLIVCVKRGVIDN